MSLPSSANPPVAVQKPGTNIYTVMLILAFCALLVACSLLAAELARFGPGVPWQTPGGS